MAPKEWHDDPNTWLSNFDIEKVMKLYEEKYKHFTFLGATPIDYDSKIDSNEYVNNKLAIFDRSYYETYSPIVGIVFNTDKHNKPGEHWFAMVIRFNTKRNYFF